MIARPVLNPAGIDADLLTFTVKKQRRFWLAAGPLAMVCLLGAVLIGLMYVFGLQLLGYNNTVYWAVPITNFIFWVGLSQAGIMVTSILRLSRAEWRRPITRIADVVSLFALGAAGIYPIIHTGRMWRTAYWILPYDFTHQVWPNIRSALIWDPAAIVTYLVGTVISIYLDLLPDLVVARDYSTGWKRSLYGLLSLGWRGTSRQWRMHVLASRLLPAFMLPVFIFVHSIVSWDLAMAIVPGWHTTIFAPYFIMDAIHSGVAAVTTAVIGLVWLLKLRDYVRPEHLDCLGRCLLATACGWLFFNVVEMYFDLFARDPLDLAIWKLRLLVGPYTPLFICYICAGFVLPVPLLLWRRARRSAGWLFAISALINVALWIERYFLVVTPLSYKEPFTFMWTSSYTWHPVEYLITLAGFAMVALGLLVFAKLFPIVSPWNVKQGQVLRRELLIGRARVFAAMRAEKG
jgi:molybdopterin-containing oxidoreductase family membrane subunit